MVRADRAWRKMKNRDFRIEIVHSRFFSESTNSPNTTGNGQGTVCTHVYSTEWHGFAVLGVLDPEPPNWTRALSLIPLMANSASYFAH